MASPLQTLRGYAGGGRREIPDDLRSTIEAIAQREGIDPALLIAVVRQETGGGKNPFDPRSAGGAGDYGLAQVTLPVAKHYLKNPGLTPEGLYDPETNLTAAARFLKDLSKKYGGDPKQVLTAYNSGETRMNRAVRAANAAGTDWESELTKINKDNVKYGNEAITLYQGGAPTQVAEVRPPGPPTPRSVFPTPLQPRTAVAAATPSRPVPPVQAPAPMPVLPPPTTQIPPTLSQPPAIPRMPLVPGGEVPTPAPGALAQPPVTTSPGTPTPTRQAQIVPATPAEIALGLDSPGLSQPPVVPPPPVRPQPPLGPPTPPEREPLAPRLPPISYSSLPGDYIGVDRGGAPPPGVPREREPLAPPIGLGAVKPGAMPPSAHLPGLEGEIPPVAPLAPSPQRPVQPMPPSAHLPGLEGEIPPVEPLGKSTWEYNPQTGRFDVVPVQPPGIAPDDYPIPGSTPPPLGLSAAAPPIGGPPMSPLDTAISQLTTEELLDLFEYLQEQDAERAGSFAAPTDPRGFMSERDPAGSVQWQQAPSMPGLSSGRPRSFQEESLYWGREGGE